MPEIDLSVLYFFNRTLASPAMDAVMSALTSVKWWMPVYVLAGAILLWRYRLNGLLLLFSAVLVITVTDQLAEHVLKPVADRPRPCAEINGERVVEWIRLPDDARQGPSFPSSHALNNAAIAVFFAGVFRSRRLLLVLLTLATVVGISRVYLGLHYPSDILGGLLIGSLIGYFFSRLYVRALPVERRAR